MSECKNDDLNNRIFLFHLLFDLSVALFTVSCFDFKWFCFVSFFNVFIWTLYSPFFFLIALTLCGCSSSFFPFRIFVCNLFTALEGNKRYFDRAPTLKFSAVSSGYLKAHRKIKITKKNEQHCVFPRYFPSFSFTPHTSPLSHHSYSIDLLLLRKCVHISMCIRYICGSSIHVQNHCTPYSTTTETGKSLIFLSAAEK